MTLSRLLPSRIAPSSLFAPLVAAGLGLSAPGLAHAAGGPAAEASAKASTSDGGSKKTFDAGYLFVGAQLAGNLSVQSLDSTKGSLGFGGSLVVEYAILPYLKIGLEPGYTSAGYTRSQVTDSGSNVVDDELNLYVDPDDLITKRGGRGSVRYDAISLPLVLKGRYPIAVGPESKGMFLAPFLSLGGQAEFNLSANYDVQNDDTFEFGPGFNKVDFKLLGGLGLEFSLGKAGQITLEGRYLWGATKAPGRDFILNSRPNASTESEFPLNFTVPESRWSRAQLLLGYRYGFALGRK